MSGVEGIDEDFESVYWLVPDVSITDENFAFLDDVDATNGGFESIYWFIGDVGNTDKCSELGC